jgi:SAM-dependent methyltransferase
MDDPWDAHADAFDDEPDHGLRDPGVRAAWKALVLPLMPDRPAEIFDLGCGTGSMSVLLAAAGHRVRALDTSARMVAGARAKATAAGVAVDLTRGDASDPPYRAATGDVVFCRHVLWAFEDRDAVLRRWVRLLRPGGRLVLVEGRWSSGAGMAATECRDVVLRHRDEASVRHLADDSALWGSVVDDERYLVYSAG